MTKEQKLWEAFQNKHREASQKLEVLIAPHRETRDAKIAQANRDFELASATPRLDFLDEIKPCEQAWIAEYQKTK